MNKVERIDQHLSRLWELEQERRALEIQFDLLEDAIDESKKQLESELNNAHPIRLLHNGRMVEIDTEHSEPVWYELTSLGTG